MSLIIITLFFYITNTLIVSAYGTSAPFTDHLLYSPHYILGLGLIIFSFGIFKTGRLNNKNIIPLGIAALVTGLFCLSIKFVILVFFSRIIYFGLLSYYLFPAGYDGETTLYTNDNSSIDGPPAQLPGANGINYFFISLKAIIIQVFKHWTAYGIILLSSAAVFFPGQPGTLSNQSIVMVFMFSFFILVFSQYFILICAVMKKFIPYTAAFSTAIIFKAFVIHSLKITALFIVLSPLSTLPLVFADKNGSLYKALIDYMPRLLFFVIYFWSLMGYTSSMIMQSSARSFKNSLLLLRSRYAVYSLFFLLLIILLQPLFTNAHGNFLLKVKNFAALSLTLLILPVSFIFLTKFTYDFSLLKKSKTPGDQ